MGTEIILPTLTDGEDKSSPFVNRIRKNYRHIRKWAKRTETDCFRIYDRDIREYPVAIDFYAGRFCVHYFLRREDNDEPNPELVEETTNALVKIFEVSPDKIYSRTRFRRAKSEQYEKVDEAKEFFTVLEYGVKFQINLVDYLDTGLFLDHRETRKLVSTLSRDKKVLNLFSYTAAFSVHAAVNGAHFTKSVDMSNTYTEWAKDNFVLNGLSLKKNHVVRADCLKFLDEEIESKMKYDLIIIDPPTISRSKKMDQMFDIQLDYIYLLSKSLKLLSKGGVIFFSTNSRKFVFDDIQFNDCEVVEISKKTLPLDFHDPKIHRCWKISKNEEKVEVC